MNIANPAGLLQGLVKLEDAPERSPRPTTPTSLWTLTSDRLPVILEPSNTILHRRCARVALASRARILGQGVALRSNAVDRKFVQGTAVPARRAGHRSRMTRTI